MVLDKCSANAMKIFANHRIRNDSKGTLTNQYRMHDLGFHTYVSIEPWFPPNIVDNNIYEVLNAISFVDKIIFGRIHYYKGVAEYAGYREYFNYMACHIVRIQAFSNLLKKLLFSRMNYDYNTLNMFAQECCAYIFSLGFQACYGIHYSQEKRLHIHLAINTTNYATGKKLSQYPKQSKLLFEQPLKNIFNKYMYQTLKLSDLT